MSLTDELHEQPTTVARLLDEGGDEAREVAAALRRPDVDHVVIAARGTSDNAARYAQYVWGGLAGMGVSLATPALFGPYDRPASLAGAAVVVVSQSGQSPDLLAVADAARDQGRPVVALTNAADSPLAARADVLLDLRAGPEHAVAATKTYTASLVAVAMIADVLTDGAGVDLGALPTVLDQALHAEGVDAAAAALADPAVALVLGRGWHLASAHEWALKLQELSGVVAQAWSTADFEHGPVAAVGAHTPVLAVSGRDDPSHDHMRELLARLARARGAPVVALTDDPAPVADGAVHVHLPAVPAGWLGPVAAAPVLQRVAIAATRRRGLDPDQPRGLAKVTRTR